MSISNPHDKFFRDVFSEPENTAELIQNALPPEILEYLDLNTLENQSVTFINESLKDVQSDLLFSVQSHTGNEFKIYLLFEHKSYIDSGIHLQLLSYIERIYSSMAKSQNLRPVIPLVFYHGPKKWNVSYSFIETMNLTEHERTIFSAFIPDFQYQLFDLTQRNPQSMILSLTLRAILYTFKNIWNLEQDIKIEGLVSLLAKAEQEPLITKRIEQLLIYIYSFTDVKPELIIKKANQLNADTLKEITMTTAQRLHEQGKLEGKLEGEYEKAVKTAKAMIQKKLDFKLIAEITDLTVEDIERLAEKS